MHASIEAHSNDRMLIRNHFFRGVVEMVLGRRNVTSRENAAFACLSHEPISSSCKQKLIILRFFSKLLVTLSSKKIMIKCFCIRFKPEKYVGAIVPMSPVKSVKKLNLTYRQRVNIGLFG